MTELRGPEFTFLYTPSSYVERLRLEKLFQVQSPLEVELGAGDGSFLAVYAQTHPETNFIGVERLLGRLRKIEKKARRAGLKNLRLVRLEISYFVRYLLPLESVSAFHIYFPDPWPKRRHWKNRLITAEFTEDLRKALVPGGVVYLRTDNRDYFNQMLRSFAANSAFHKIETPLSLLATTTDFERGFHAESTSTLHAAYGRVQ